MKSLYAFRPVINGDAIFAWAKAAGFPTAMLPDNLHVTIIYCKAPFERDDLLPDPETVTLTGGRRTLEKLGSDDDKCAALIFESPALSRRYKEILAAGASSDWPDLKCHISLSWNAADIDLGLLGVYDGPIILGPEQFEEIAPDNAWKEKIVEKAAIIKVHEIEKVENGLVFGWGIICKINGQDYYDVQGDHIPEDVMLKGVSEFMIAGRVAREMHKGEAIGMMVHSFPMTSDIAKALEIKTAKTGWLVAMKPDNPDVLAKFAEKTFTGFSIGGTGGFEADA